EFGSNMAIGTAHDPVAISGPSTDISRYHLPGWHKTTACGRGMSHTEEAWRLPARWLCGRQGQSERALCSYRYFQRKGNFRPVKRKKGLRADRYDPEAIQFLCDPASLFPGLSFHFDLSNRPWCRQKSAVAAGTRRGSAKYFGQPGLRDRC